MNHMDRSFQLFKSYIRERLRDWYTKLLRLYIPG